MRWGTRRRESGDSPGGGYQAGRPVPLPSMTTGAGQVLPQPTDDRAARLAARAGFGAGVAGALANMLLVAFAVLAFARPGPVQAALWPLACAAAGTSAVLLIPVVLVLGGASVVSLGVASMAFSAVAFLMLVTGLLAPTAGASLLAGCGLGLRDLAVPGVPRRERAAAGRARRPARRRGGAGRDGARWPQATSRCRPSSTAWLAVLVLGGVPAVLGLAGRARVDPARGRWLRQDGQGGAGRYDEDGRTASPGGDAGPLRRLVAWAPSSPSTRTPTTRPSPRRHARRGPRRPGTGSCSSSPPAASWARPVPGVLRRRGSSWPCAAPPSATPRRRRSGPSAWSSSASPTPG